MKSKMKTKTYNIRSLTLIALLAALSAVLMTINFPLPFAPPFLKFDIAEFPGLFAGFFLGPTASVIVVVLKNLLKLLLQGTETAYVGEFMNALGSILFTLPAAFIYKYRKNIKGARIALIASTLIGSLAWIPLNLFIGFPMYAAVYSMSTADIVGMGSSVNPLINNMFTIMLFGILPFNLVKLSVTSLVTWWMYKRVGGYLRSLVGLSEKAGASSTS